MERNFDFYQSLIENTELSRKFASQAPSNTFWDLIVITSISEEQKLCYEKQIESKLISNNLPKQFNFLVINDPNDCKIGSGGSTLNVIKQLSAKYNEQFYKMKILLIHAGGYSQRMPTCSVLGKIFSSIPSKYKHINDLLDLKLAIYTPFSVYMQPGVFLTSSDDFETFYLEEQIDSSKYFGSDQNDFVLIAHKSPLAIGKDHGVYVLDEKISQTVKFNVYNCKCVLQKPSIEKIQELGIVLKDKNQEDFVYTDSVFYFSHKVSKDLIQFYEKYFEYIKENKIEIDAYRDFLQPLGKSPIKFEEFKKPFKIKNDLLLSDLYNLFLNRNCLILGLNDSDFFHLGTLNEMFNYYFDSSSLFSIKFRQSICLEGSSSQGCVIKSRIGNKVGLNQTSLVEYCYFDDEIELNLNEYSFISNCKLVKSELNFTRSLEIPGNICFHTIPISFENKAKYITIFFSRTDDLKKAYAKISQVKFLGKEIPKFLEDSLKSCKEFSIWNLRVFKSYETMSESFVKSLEFVESFLKTNQHELLIYFNQDLVFYSLFDLLKNSNYGKMIQFRVENGLI